MASRCTDCGSEGLIAHSLTIPVPVCYFCKVRRLTNALLDAESRESIAAAKPIDDANPDRHGPAMAPGWIGLPNIEPTQFRQKERPS